jgi:hypothetical protein
MKTFGKIMLIIQCSLLIMCGLYIMWAENKIVEALILFSLSTIISKHLNS